MCRKRLLMSFMSNKINNVFMLCISFRGLSPLTQKWGEYSRRYVFLLMSKSKMVLLLLMDRQVCQVFRQGKYLRRGERGDSERGRDNFTQTTRAVYRLPLQNITASVRLSRSDRIATASPGKITVLISCFAITAMTWAMQGLKLRPVKFKGVESWSYMK